MRESNQLKMGIVLSYIVMAVGYIVSFLYTPIMIKSLGQSEYGTYNYVISFVNYLSLFSCGFGSAYIRFYSRYKADSNKTDKDISCLNGMFMTIFMVMGSLAFITGMVLSLFSDEIFGGHLTAEELKTANILMKILVVNLFISFPASVFNSYIITKEKFVYQKIIALIQTLLGPIVILSILSRGYKSIGLACGSLIVTVLIFIVNSCYCVFHEKMRFRFTNFDRSLLKEIIAFSSFLLLSMVVDQINWSVDKFLLGKICGSLIVAVYTVGGTLNTYYRQISEHISNVFVPRINRMVASGESDKEISDLFIKLGRIQFIILALIFTGFVFFGKTFISLWLGNSYSNAYYITIILMLPVTVPEIQKIGLEVLKAKNLHRFRSIVYFFIALINIALTIPLAYSFGGVGAALGTAVTVIAGNGIIMNIYYYKKAKLDIPRFWREILKLCRGAVPCIIVGIIILKLDFINNWPVFFAMVAVYTMLFLIAEWLLGMNEYEKGLIIRIANKLKRLS